MILTRLTLSSLSLSLLHRTTKEERRYRRGGGARVD
jgi:hypothetical protein